MQKTLITTQLFKVYSHCSGYYRVQLSFIGWRYSVWNKTLYWYPNYHCSYIIMCDFLSQIVNLDLTLKCTVFPYIDLSSLFDMLYWYTFLTIQDTVTVILAWQCENPLSNNSPFCCLNKVLFFTFYPWQNLNNSILFISKQICC